MAHIINAVILKGTYNKEEAEKYELRGVELDFNLNLFFVDKYYTAYWQKKLGTTGYLVTNNSFKNEMVIFELMKRIAHHRPIQYATIATAYVGGMGEQYANAYQDQENVDVSINDINKALHYLGVSSSAEDDEFDRVGLGRFRKNPDFLDKYRDMAKDLGVDID
jgi:hypothetical protein